MGESETSDLKGEVAVEGPSRKGWLGYLWEPYVWLAMLAKELHGSFVFGVVIVYGVSQGLGGAFYRIVSSYYWKDAQKVQPSAAQVYQGIISIPWIMKPVWGLLTDILPVAGYQRRPYFILAGSGLFLVGNFSRDQHLVFYRIGSYMAFWIFFL